MNDKDKQKHQAGIMLAIAEHNQGVKKGRERNHADLADKIGCAKRERLCRGCQYYTPLADAYGYCDSAYVVKKTRRKVWAGWTCNDFTDGLERTLFDG